MADWLDDNSLDRRMGNSCMVQHLTNPCSVNLAGL